MATYLRAAVLSAHPTVLETLRRHRMAVYLLLLALMGALFAPHLIELVFPNSIFPTLLPYSLQNQLNPRIEFTPASYISAAFFAVLGVAALWGARQLRHAPRITRLGYLVIGLLGLYLMVDEPIGIHEKLAQHVDAFLLHALKIDLSNSPIASGHSWALVALPVSILFLVVCVGFFRSHLRARPALIALAVAGLAMWVYAIVGELLYGALDRVGVDRLTMLEEWTEETSEILGAIFLTIVLIEGLYPPAPDLSARGWPWQALRGGSHRRKIVSVVLLIGPIVAALAGVALTLVIGYGRTKIQALLSSGLETVAVGIILAYALALHELITSVGLSIICTMQSRPSPA